MEKQAQVFESPDYPKTIEEINEEIEPKSFPPVAGLVAKQPDMQLTDIFKYFENLTQSAPPTQYISERKSTTSRFLYITELESELNEIQRELASNSAYDSKEQLHKQASDLAVLLTSVKEKAHKSVETGSCKWRAALETKVEGMAMRQAPGVTYEVSVTRSTQDLQYRQRLSRLEERIKQIERSLGDWKRSKSVCDTMSSLQRHVQMMNSSLLEHIENQSKNLTTDLDLLFTTSKSEFQVEKETMIALSTLQTDISEPLSTISTLPAIVERAAAIKPLQDLSLRLNERIQKLEEISACILASAAEQSDICATLSAGIQENQEIVWRNLAQLSL